MRNLLLLQNVKLRTIIKEYRVNDPLYKMHEKPRIKLTQVGTSFVNRFHSIQ